jgi:hypothetical protein
MRDLNLKLLLAAAGCVGMLALPAAAEHWDFTWDHPCADDPENEQTCKAPAGTPCWCEGVWDEADHWVQAGWPDESTDIVRINHSNTGYCSNGDPCLDDDDCTGDCDYYEDHLRLELVTETIASLTITTAGTFESGNSLEIRFEGSGTLTLRQPASLMLTWP